MQPTSPVNELRGKPGVKDTLQFAPGLTPGQFLLLKRDETNAVTLLPPEVKGIRELGPSDWVLLQWDGVANWHKERASG